MELALGALSLGLCMECGAGDQSVLIAFLCLRGFWARLRFASGGQKMQVEQPKSGACPSCHTPWGADARFCSQCGAKGAVGVAAEHAPPAAAARRICKGCSKLNDVAAQFCLRCGTKLPAETTLPAFGEPAGFWIRVLAALIDGVLLAAVGWLIDERLGLPHGVSDTVQSAEVLNASLLALSIDVALGAVYASIMVGAWGATVGKMVCGLRIVRGDGGRVTYGVGLTRNFAQLVSLLPAGLGFIWVALSPSKLGWHDYLCDTRVVYKRVG